MVWFARRHPDSPFLAKALCFMAVAYALSPIDLIPDFIPVLGYLDDVILLPALIWLAVCLLPRPVVDACRTEAEQWMRDQQARPQSYGAALAIIIVWIVVTGLTWNWYRQYW